MVLEGGLDLAGVSWVGAGGVVSVVEVMQHDLPMLWVILCCLVFVLAAWLWTDRGQCLFSVYFGIVRCYWQVCLVLTGRLTKV